MLSSSNGNIIGYVSDASGPIQVTDSNGNIRVVQVGDPIYLNETVENGSAAVVVIELINGQLVNLAVQQQLVMGPEILSLFEETAAGEEEDREVSPEEGERESVPSSAAESDENENAEGSESPTDSGLNEQFIIEREDSTSEGPGSVEEADQENDEAQQGQSTSEAQAPLPTEEAQTFEIESQSFSVDENVLSDGSVIVGSVNAQTQGAQRALTYAITGGNDEGKFSIDPQSGDISVVGELDHELTNSFDLTVQVTGAGGVSESAQVSIAVNNLNEAPDANEDTGSTYENVTLLLDVLANDTDVDLDDDSRKFQARCCGCGGWKWRSCQWLWVGQHC